MVRRFGDSTNRDVPEQDVNLMMEAVLAPERSLNNNFKGNVNVQITM